FIFNKLQRHVGRIGRLRRIRHLLYLDGTISHMYMKGGAIPWQRYPFVTMISVERKG
ncbi:hypothetical protein ACUOFC_50500, partial [Escherichia sp. TWPC-MK]